MKYLSKFYSNKPQINKFTYLSFLLVLIVSVFTNFYRLEARHGFGWDQERDAEIVYYQMINSHKPSLIGPRVVSADGFYLGPLHFYILLPFYFLSRGDPIAGAVLAAFIGVITSATFYLITYLFSKNWTASLIAGLFMALNPFVTSWNVMYMSGLTIIIYFFCVKIIEREYGYIPLTFLFVSAALQFHFSAIFLIAAVIFSIVLSNPSKKDTRGLIKLLLISSMIFLSFLFPLLIFDIRHEFINTKLFIAFFIGGDGNLKLNISKSVGVFLRSFNFIYTPGNKVLNLLLNIGLIAMFLTQTLRKDRANIKKLNIFWMFLPLLVLVLYKGEISEYYFLTSVSLIILYFSLFLSFLINNKLTRYLTIFLLITIFYIKFKTVLSTVSLESMYNKKQVVEYMVTQTDYPIFNISYSTALGHNSGFNYLFKYYGKEPQDIPEGHLYTIVIPSHAEDILPIFTSGDIGLIRR